MSTTKKNVSTKLEAPDPKKLDSITFFSRLGFDLSDEQKKLRDAIYSPDIDIIFVNAPAGTGKTLIAVSTACLMVECGLYSKILYCFSLNNGFQTSLGLIPGSVEDKESSFYEPCLQALVSCGYQPEKVVKELSVDGGKSGTAFVSCRSHTFLRGTNIDRDTILIVDEAQNFYLDELKKVLTRVKDGAKVIVIGHSGQNDIIAHSEYSGFVPYIEHFKDKPRTAICELTQNFRGWLSKWADELDVPKARAIARKNLQN